MLQSNWYRSAITHTDVLESFWVSGWSKFYLLSPPGGDCLMISSNNFKGASMTRTPLRFLHLLASRTSAVPLIDVFTPRLAAWPRRRGSCNSYETFGLEVLCWQNINNNQKKSKNNSICLFRATHPITPPPTRRSFHQHFLHICSPLFDLKHQRDFKSSFYQ